METKKLAIIATKGTLDWAYPPFILASTAAALGYEVQIFFNFYGLQLVRKDVSGLKVNPLGNPGIKKSATLVEKQSSKGWLDWDSEGTEAYSYYVYPVESDDPPGVNQYAQFLLSDGYQTITLEFNSDRDNPEAGVHKLGNLIDALTEFRNHLETAVETRKVLRNLSRVKE